jgi:nucleotide-binding universal stress UspA family protein
MDGVTNLVLACIDGSVLTGTVCDYAAWIAKDERLMVAANKPKRAGGIELVTVKLEGQPEHALCEYQARQAIDLTIMGAFRHTRLHGLLLGSFTVKMLTKSKGPLLLLR